MKSFGGFLHDEDERRKWQNPENILAEVGLSRGMTFIDIGCGQGFFTIPAARIVGDNGKVYASDISQTNIAKLQKKLNAGGLNNVIVEAGKAEDLLSCEGCADIVFFGIVLHDFENPLKVLANAHAMLKPTGKLVDLDWKKEPTEIGPPLNIRFSEEQASQLLATSGFHTQLVLKSGLYHYIIMATLE